MEDETSEEVTGGSLISKAAGTKLMAYRGRNSAGTNAGATGAGLWKS